MTKQINLNDDQLPLIYHFDMRRRQLVVNALSRAGLTRQDSQKKLKYGTFCGSCLPEFRQMSDGRVVFEGEA